MEAIIKFRTPDSSDEVHVEYLGHGWAACASCAGQWAFYGFKWLLICWGGVML